MTKTHTINGFTFHITRHLNEVSVVSGDKKTAKWSWDNMRRRKRIP